jgi:fibronectin type 3 domain-containing protein
MVKKSFLYLFLLLMVVAALSCCHSNGGGNSPSGTATLDWTAPTKNSDSSALTDLAGYKVYYGTASRSYSQSIDVGKVTTYELTNLSNGFTYYFVVTAYNQAGVESEPSNEGNKAIN